MCWQAVGDATGPREDVGRGLGEDISRQQAVINRLGHWDQSLGWRPSGVGQAGNLVEVILKKQLLTYLFVAERGRER